MYGVFNRSFQENARFTEVAWGLSEVRTLYSYICTKKVGAGKECVTLSTCPPHVTGDALAISSCR